MPSLIDKQIRQAGVRPVHDKGAVPIVAPSVRVFKNGNCLRPRFVVIGDTPIPILLTDGIRQHIERSLIPELVNNLFYCAVMEDVIEVVSCYRLLNGFLASNIRFA